MTAIRNLCVARGQVAASTLATVYTVPDGFVLLLKDIRINLAIAAADQAVFLLQAAGGTPTVTLAIVSTTTTEYFASWSGWLAMNGGDMIGINTVTNGLSYWVSGALLPFAPNTLPPLAQQLPGGAGGIVLPPDYPLPPS
jgi:hypothetical protein